MIGVVPTSYSLCDENHGFVTVLQCESETVGQLLLEQYTNEQPLEILPK
jgi:hypothetical protein